MCSISIAVKPDILKGFFSFSFLHLRESFYNINCYSKSKWNPLKYHRINYFKNFQWIWISLSWIKVSRMIFYDMNIKKLHTICGIVVLFKLLIEKNHFWLEIHWRNFLLMIRFWKRYLQCAQGYGMIYLIIFTLVWNSNIQYQYCFILR